jgi:hypothetical protein
MTGAHLLPTRYTRLLWVIKTEIIGAYGDFRYGFLPGILWGIHWGILLECHPQQAAKSPLTSP